ncbi:MAG: 4Fe-4S single cluster domain-containing protein [Candidatus Uhrbacteria bacterium]|nr:4Fe-4S single cluster domain-containing protein [Candidatus Uhrbacteria bacterium]
MLLNLGGQQEVSSAMGPGKRSVLWVRGCSILCSGCITPEYLDHAVRTETTVEEVCEWITRMKFEHQIEGVSFSGGEPFEQAKALAFIARACRELGLSIQSWSGYTKRYLEKGHAPDGSRELLETLDVLIDGPFIRQRPTSLPLRGSSNQHLHLLTDRYKVEDFEQRYMELVIDPKQTRAVGVMNHAHLRAALALSGILGDV